MSNEHEPRHGEHEATHNPANPGQPTGTVGNPYAQFQEPAPQVPHNGWAPSASSHGNAGGVPSSNAGGNPGGEGQWQAASAPAAPSTAAQFGGDVPGTEPHTNEWGAQPGTPEHPGQPAAGEAAPGQVGFPTALAAPARAKRTVGLGTALALMLAGSIGAGVLTAATLGNSNHITHDYSALNEKSVSRAENAQPGSVEEVAQRVLPSVVSIQVSTRKGAGEGSGSIISADGQVLTNHHVVGDAKNGGVIDVTLNDGSVHPADYVASDASTDIAVIKIRDVKNLPVLNFGDSSQVAVGQEVVAIGSPLGLSATVTSGIVSALNRPVRASGGEGGESSLIDAIQTDAAINPGNSGGPLVDMHGNLVGMNSVIASLSSGSSQQSGSIGLGFAIPANQAKRIAQQLVETGEVKQPVIGVKVSQNSEYRGALVAAVDPGSPADKAGIGRGDMVTKVNDRVIDNADALIAAVRSQEFGSTVKLEITKPDSKEKRTVDVTLPTAG